MLIPKLEHLGSQTGKIGVEIYTLRTSGQIIMHKPLFIQNYYYIVGTHLV